ncbi:MAG: hypothetical protein ABIS01_00240 [Ferruginibacter sp.]
MRKLSIILFSFWISTCQAQVAAIGKSLPAWQEGYLDLHHINTGRGNATFYILPDGTTMLFDAGELDPTNPRTLSRRNTPICPNDSKHPFEWIVHYINQVSPLKEKAVIDYAVISHFHDDHFGSWYPSAPLAADGKYALSGITGVATLLPVARLVTRDYNYPLPMEDYLKTIPDARYRKTWSNYLSFVKELEEKGMVTQFLKAGSRTQLALKHPAKKYADFYIQNVKSNGSIWSGKDSMINEHFPPVDTHDKKTWPDENTLSNVLVIHYGPFSYYTGGDCPGNVFPGDSAWRDVETPVAKAIGEVDVATMDHHGNRDAVNSFQIKTFKPSVWIEQVWTADHPGHETLIRITSPLLYKEKRDLFATNMMEANKDVIGPLVDRSYKSLQGHILVRVMPGGNQYYIIILDDSREDMPVKKIFGPYAAKST